MGCARVTEDISERFKQDIATHAVEILLDNGVYRHLKCRRPGTYCYGFDIVTWPGLLSYSGDMGTFVFSRLHDMFEFFRHDAPHKPDFGYWAEKAVAVDKHGGIESYSPELFSENVRNYFKESGWFEEASFGERKAMWLEIKESVLSAADYQHDAMNAAMTFDHKISQSSPEFRFHDFYEYSTDAYTFRFLWCAHALAWAIGQYDALKSHGRREVST